MRLLIWRHFVFAHVNKLMNFVLEESWRVALWAEAVPLREPLVITQIGCDESKRTKGLHFISVDYRKLN